MIKFGFIDGAWAQTSDYHCSVAAAIVGGAVVGGIATGVVGSNAASSAASAQENAAQTAANEQQNQFNATQAGLQPYENAGAPAANALSTLTGAGTDNPLTSPLLAPFQPTNAQLDATPGYQFALDQGLKATQNANSATGWGTSGPGAKALQGYAEGLASQTYQQQFNNYVTNQTNQYNRLQGLASLGQTSAANVGAYGTQTAANIGSAIVGGGNAAAAGQIGSANAISSGINGITNGFTTNALLQGMYGTGGDGFGAPTPEQPTPFY